MGLRSHPPGGNVSGWRQKLQSCLLTRNRLILKISENRAAAEVSHHVVLEEEEKPQVTF